MAEEMKSLLDQVNEQYKINEGDYDGKWFNKINYDELLGITKKIGDNGHMKLVDLDYKRHNAKFLMLDEKDRVRWTTFEWLQYFIRGGYLNT